MNLLPLTHNYKGYFYLLILMNMSLLLAYSRDFLFTQLARMILSPPSSTADLIEVLSKK